MLSVWMEVLPIDPKVEIEQVPPDSLAGMRDDRRSVANERSSVEADGRQVIAAEFNDAVPAGRIVFPGDLAADSDGDIRRAEGEVDSRDIRCARAALLHCHRPGHGGTVDSAHVMVGRGD